MSANEEREEIKVWLRQQGLTLVGRIFDVSWPIYKNLRRRSQYLMLVIYLRQMASEITHRITMRQGMEVQRLLTTLGYPLGRDGAGVEAKPGSDWHKQVLHWIDDWCLEVVEEHAQAPRLVSHRIVAAGSCVRVRD